MVTAILASPWTALAQQSSAPEWQIKAGGKMSFEVASVKPDSGPFRPPSFPLDAGGAYRPTGGRFTADFSLFTYITFAYKLNLAPDQRQALLAHAPKWVSEDRYAIEARAPTNNPTKDQMRLMMQSLLAERFGLAVHFETQTVAAFTLVLAKPGKLGPQLRPHDEGPPCDQEPSSAGDKAAGRPEVFPGQCESYGMMGQANGMRIAGSRNTTLELLASVIPSFGGVSRPVVDHTGLTGRFDFKLEWMPESTSTPPPGANPQPEPAGPTFFQALKEQLGLQLEATKAPLPVLVIDHVERPSEN